MSICSWPVVVLLVGAGVMMSLSAGPLSQDGVDQLFDDLFAIFIFPYNEEISEMVYKYDVNQKKNVVL